MVIRSMRRLRYRRYNRVLQNRTAPQPVWTPTPPPKPKTTQAPVRKSAPKPIPKQKTIPRTIPAQRSTSDPVDNTIMLPQQIMVTLGPINHEGTPEKFYSDLKSTSRYNFENQTPDDFNSPTNSTYPIQKRFVDLYANYTTLSVGLRTAIIDTSFNASNLQYQTSMSTKEFKLKWPEALINAWGEKDCIFNKRPSGYLPIAAAAHPNWAHSHGYTRYRPGVKKNCNYLNTLNPWGLGWWEDPTNNDSGVYVGAADPDKKLNRLDAQLSIWGGACRGGGGGCVPTTRLDHCKGNNAFTNTSTAKWGGCSLPTGVGGSITHWSQLLQPNGDDMTITSDRLAAMIRPLGMVNWDGSTLGYDGKNVIVILQSSWLHRSYYGCRDDEECGCIGTSDGTIKVGQNWFGPGTSLGVWNNSSDCQKKIDPNFYNYPRFTTAFAVIRGENLSKKSTDPITIDQNSNNYGATYFPTYGYKDPIMPVSPIATYQYKGSTGIAAFIGVNTNTGWHPSGLTGGLNIVANSAQYILGVLSYNIDDTTGEVNGAPIFGKTGIGHPAAFNPSRPILTQNLTNIDLVDTNNAANPGTIGSNMACQAPIIYEYGVAGVDIRIAFSDPNPRIFNCSLDTNGVGFVASFNTTPPSTSNTVGELFITQGLQQNTQTNQKIGRALGLPYRDANEWNIALWDAHAPTPFTNTGTITLNSANGLGGDAGSVGISGFAMGGSSIIPGPIHYAPDATVSNPYDPGSSPTVQLTGLSAPSAGATQHGDATAAFQNLTNIESFGAMNAPERTWNGNKNTFPGLTADPSYNAFYTSGDPTVSETWSYFSTKMIGLSGDRVRIAAAGVPLVVQGDESGNMVGCGFRGGFSGTSPYWIKESVDKDAATRTETPWVSGTTAISGPLYSMGVQPRGHTASFSGTTDYWFSKWYDGPPPHFQSVEANFAENDGVLPIPSPSSTQNPPDLLTSYTSDGVASSDWMSAQKRANYLYPASNWTGTDSMTAETADYMKAVAAGSRNWKRMAASDIYSQTEYWQYLGVNKGQTLSFPPQPATGTSPIPNPNPNPTFNNPSMVQWQSPSMPYDPPPNYDGTPYQSRSVQTGVTGPMPYGSTALWQGALPATGPHDNPQTWSQLTEPWATLPYFSPWARFLDVPAPDVDDVVDTNYDNSYNGIISQSELSGASMCISTLALPGYAALPWSGQTFTEDKVYDIDQPLGDTLHAKVWPSLTSDPAREAIIGAVWNINPKLKGGTAVFTGYTEKHTGEFSGTALSWHHIGDNSGITFNFGGHGGAGTLVSLGTSGTTHSVNQDYNTRWIWRGMGLGFTLTAPNTKSPVPYSGTYPQIIYRGHNTSAYTTYWAGGQRAANGWTGATSGAEIQVSGGWTQEGCPSCGSPQASVPPVSLDPQFLCKSTRRLSEGFAEVGITGIIGSLPQFTNHGTPSWYWSLPQSGLLDPVQDGVTGSGKWNWSTYYPYVGSVILGSGVTRGGVGSTAGPLIQNTGTSEINSYYPGPLNAYQGVSSSPNPTLSGQPLEGQLDIRSSPGWYGVGNNTSSKDMLTRRPLSNAWLNPMEEIYTGTEWIGEGNNASFPNGPGHIQSESFTNMSSPPKGNWLSEVPANRLPQSERGAASASRFPRAWSPCSAAVNGLGPNVVQWGPPHKINNGLTTAFPYAPIPQQYIDMFGSKYNNPIPSKFKDIEFEISPPPPFQPGSDNGSLSDCACDKSRGIFTNNIQTFTGGCSQACRDYYSYTGVFKYYLTGTTAWSSNGLVAPTYTPISGTTALTGLATVEIQPALNNCIRLCNMTGGSQVCPISNDGMDGFSELTKSKVSDNGPAAFFPGRFPPGQTAYVPGANPAGAYTAVGQTTQGYLCGYKYEDNHTYDPPQWNKKYNVNLDASLSGLHFDSSQGGCGNSSQSKKNPRYRDWYRKPWSAPLWPCGKSGSGNIDNSGKCNASLLGDTDVNTYSSPTATAPSVGTVGHTWGNITWNVHDLTGSGTYGFFVGPNPSGPIGYISGTYEPPSWNTDYSGNTAGFPLAYNTGTSNTYTWQGSTVHGPSWANSNYSGPGATFWANTAWKIYAATASCPATIAGPTMWPAPYSYPANRLTLPSACWCRLGWSDHGSSGVQSGFGPYRFTDTFEKTVVPITKSCERTGYAHMLRGYCAPTYSWAFKIGKKIPYFDGTSAGTTSLDMQYAWRDVDVPKSTDYRTNTEDCSARIYWKKYRCSAAYAGLTAGTDNGGAAWHGRVVGVSNPYPGAGSLGGACISANKGMSGNYFVGNYPIAPPSQRPLHALSCYITGWHQDISLEPLSSSSLKNVLSSSVYGDPKNGLSQTLVNCGVMGETGGNVDSAARFPDARILCPYSEFQLYQVPMLVALAYDGSNLTLRVLRASDGMICADIPFDPSVMTAIMGTDMVATLSSLAGSLIITPLPNINAGTSQPPVTCPVYWGNRPLIEPAYDAQHSSHSSEINSKPNSVFDQSANSIKSLGDAVSESFIWDGPAPRGKATPLEIAKKFDGMWNLWRVVWTSQHNATKADPRLSGAIFSGILASSQTSCALPQAAQTEGDENYGARWWAFEGELTHNNGFTSFDGHTGYAGPVCVRGPRGITLTTSKSYHDIADASGAYTAWPTGVTFMGGAMGQTYYPPLPHNSSQNNNTYYTNGIPGAGMKPGTAPAYALTALGGTGCNLTVNGPVSLKNSDPNWVSGPLGGQPGGDSGCSLCSDLQRLHIVDELYNNGTNFSNTGIACDPWNVALKHSFSNSIIISGSDYYHNTTENQNDPKSEWSSGTTGIDFTPTGKYAAQGGSWPTWP